jgi:hypothetical protein
MEILSSACVIYDAILEYDTTTQRRTMYDMRSMQHVRDNN